MRHCNQTQVANLKRFSAVVAIAFSVVSLHLLNKSGQKPSRSHAPASPKAPTIGGMNTEFSNRMGYHAGAWEPERTTDTDCPALLRRYVSLVYYLKVIKKMFFADSDESPNNSGDPCQDNAGMTKELTS